MSVSDRILGQQTDHGAVDSSYRQSLGYGAVGRGPTGDRESDTLGAGGARGEDSRSEKLCHFY